MNRLFLLRHAKAGWARPGTRDIDRPLTDSGIADARALGIRMREAGYRAGIVLCSPARRARDTWGCVAEGLADGAAPEPRILPVLYDGGAQDYLKAVRDAGPVENLVLVGHNPIMEDLGTALPSRGDEAATLAIARGFPACGLAVIDFAREFTEIGPGGGVLVDFIVPARH